MAKSCSIFLLFFLLSAFTLCSSGTLVGFFYDARKPYSSSSAAETISTLKLNKINPSQIRVLVEDFRVLDSSKETNVDVDLYLSDKYSALSSLKSYLLTNLPHVKIKNIILTNARTDLYRKNELQLLLTTLKSVHSMLKSFLLEKELKVSVEFSLSFLENLKRENKKHERDLSKIFNFINKIRSFVIVEAEFNERDRFIESVAERANLAISALSCSNISIALNIKNSVFSPQELAKMNGRISWVLDSIKRIDENRIIQLFVEANLINDFKKKEKIFHSSQRVLLKIETTEYGTDFPPTNTLPTNPTPTIVTVTPNPISNTPVTIPLPVTNPVTTPTTVPMPVTNPVTTPSTVPAPVTNPVINNPTPAGGAPAAGSSPAGQSWCVAKSGASQAAVQAALDYACGIGGADCSTIQQGGSCYNPNSLQSHASYAFNSYYQKNPVQTSCDFGGTAMVTTTNPSTGSCIFPSSLSSLPANTSPTPMPTTSSPTPTVPVITPPPASVLPPPVITPMPPTPMLPTPMPQTPPSSGDTIPGYGTPPSVLNSSNPATGIPIYGDGPPSINNTSTVSPSNCLNPLFGRIILLTLLIAGKFVLDM